jgi:hypothetical protein
MAEESYGVNQIRIDFSVHKKNRNLFMIYDGDKGSAKYHFYVFNNALYSVFSSSDDPITKTILDFDGSPYLIINIDNNTKTLYMPVIAGGGVMKCTWTRVPGENVVIDRKKRAVYTNGFEFRVRTIDARSGKYKYVKY